MIDEVKKHQLKIKLTKLIRNRKNEHKKFMENFQPRYDEIYWEGIKWLDSL